MASTRKTEVKMEKLCRTCLSKDIELFSIYDICIGIFPLDFVVSSVTGIKINKNDGLPPTICTMCKDTAIKAFEYKKKSEEAYVSLRGIMKNEKKEWPSSTKTLSQTITRDVKTEETSSNDNDDFTDNEFNITVTCEPDLPKLDDVKNENENETQDKKPCFTCKTCLVSFKTPKKLLQHKKSCVKVECDSANSSFCPLCGTSFNGAENLTKHMWENHSELMGPKKRGRPKKLLTSAILSKLSENGFCITSVPVIKHECKFCQLFFDTKEELERHLVGHKDSKLPCCTLCKKIFVNQPAFDKHICIDEKATNNDTDDENKVEGTEKKTLAFQSDIPMRDLLNPNIEVFQDNINTLRVCKACSAVLMSETELYSHVDAEHPELSHRCNHCTKVFASLRSAARHRTVCEQIERKYSCSTCEMKFVYEISLNKHILRYHEGQSVSVQFIDSKTKLEKTQYQCDTCKRSFYKRELLIKHTKIHTPVEKFFECDVCQKKFHRRDNLRSHKRVHEMQDNKVMPGNCLCLYCGRSFSNSSNLIVHMRRHTGEKPYKCDFCDKGFPRSSDLQCHRRSHTGEKPCICRVCGKGFSRSNKLSRHMRVHTGQRPYKCTYCEKAFSQSNDLNLHIRRHTGDRPYNCEVCGDRFIQGTALQNHRRAHGHFSTSVPTVTSNEGQALSFAVQSMTHTSHSI